jgi:exopolysaccharide production protein ExoZ
VKKLSSIHFLRMVAALGVVIHHVITSSGSAFMLGAAGVDVFFVISGVVISLALERESAREFGMKRAIRVLPLYWIATVIFAVFRFHAYQIEPTFSDWVRSFLLIPRTGWAPIYYAGWTLCYEALFYVVATTSIALFGPMARNACIALVMAIAAAFNLPLLLEFGAGMLIGQLVMQGRVPDIRQGLFCVTIAIGLFLHHTGAVGDERMIVWGIPAALLVYGMLAFDRSKLFRSNTVQIGGDASYALYLFHLPIVEGIGIIMPHGIATDALQVVAAVGVAIVVRVAIERPMLRCMSAALIQRKLSAKLPPEPA